MISSWYLHEITEYKKNPIFISFFALLLILNHDFVLIRTCKILKRVDLPCERKPVSWQYCWYKSTILEAITVLTTFGISIFSRFDNFSVFVPHAASFQGILNWRTTGSTLPRAQGADRKNSFTAFSPDFTHGVEKHSYEMSSSGNKELTNWRLSRDDAVRLRDRLTAHVYLGTCRRRAKVDAVVDSDSPVS